eukprot:CFRG8544T1
MIGVYRTSSCLAFNSVWAISLSIALSIMVDTHDGFCAENKISADNLECKPCEYDSASAYSQSNRPALLDQPCSSPKKNALRQIVSSPKLSNPRRNQLGRKQPPQDNKVMQSVQTEKAFQVRPPHAEHHLQQKRKAALQTQQQGITTQTSTHTHFSHIKMKTRAPHHRHRQQTQQRVQQRRAASHVSEDNNRSSHTQQSPCPQRYVRKQSLPLTILYSGSASSSISTSLFSSEAPQEDKCRYASVDSKICTIEQEVKSKRTTQSSLSTSSSLNLTENNRTSSTARSNSEPIVQFQAMTKTEMTFEPNNFTMAVEATKIEDENIGGVHIKLPLQHLSDSVNLTNATLNPNSDGNARGHSSAVQFPSSVLVDQPLPRTRAHSVPRTENNHREPDKKSELALSPTTRALPLNMPLSSVVRAPQTGAVAYQRHHEALLRDMHSEAVEKCERERIQHETRAELLEREVRNLAARREKSEAQAGLRNHGLRSSVRLWRSGSNVYGSNDEPADKTSQRVEQKEGTAVEQMYTRHSPIPIVCPNIQNLESLSPLSPSNTLPDTQPVILDKSIPHPTLPTPSLTSVDTPASAPTNLFTIDYAKPTPVVVACAKNTGANLIPTSHRTPQSMMESKTKITPRVLSNGLCVQHLQDLIDAHATTHSRNPVAPKESSAGIMSSKLVTNSSNPLSIASIVSKSLSQVVNPVCGERTTITDASPSTTSDNDDNTDTEFNMDCRESISSKNTSSYPVPTEETIQKHFVENCADEAYIITNKCDTKTVITEEASPVGAASMKEDQTKKFTDISKDIDILVDKDPVTDGKSEKADRTSSQSNETMTLEPFSSVDSFSAFKAMLDGVRDASVNPQHPRNFVHSETLLSYEDENQYTVSSMTESYHDLLKSAAHVKFITELLDGDSGCDQENDKRRARARSESKIDLHKPHPNPNPNPNPQTYNHMHTHIQVFQDVMHGTLAPHQYLATTDRTLQYGETDRCGYKFAGNNISFDFSPTTSRH